MNNWNYKMIKYNILNLKKKIRKQKNNLKANDEMRYCLLANQLLLLETENIFIRSKEKMLNFICKGNFILKKKVKIEKALTDIKSKYKCSLSSEYRNYLFEITKLISNKEIKKDHLSKLSFKEEDLVKIVDSMYKSTGDAFLKAEVSKINHNKILKKLKDHEKEDTFEASLSYYDLVNNKSYIGLKETKTIQDLMSLSHQYMRLIEVKSSRKSIFNSNEGLSEILPHAAEWMILDFLEERGLDSYYVNQGRNLLDNELVLKAKDIVRYAETEPTKSFDKRLKEKESEMLEIISKIVGKEISKTHKKEKRLGNWMIRESINKIFTKEENPSFNHLDLDYNKILEIARDYGNAKIKKKRA